MKMKKYILTLTAFAAALSAMASSFSLADKTYLRTENLSDFSNFVAAPAITQERKAPARAAEDADEIYYTLAGAPYQATTFNNATAGMQIAMAFQIEPNFLAGLTDCEITGISYYTGTHYTKGINMIRKATVFIASALDGTYLYTQEASAPETAFTKVDVTLDTPFTIPAGTTKLYVGVYFAVPDVDCLPIVFDYLAHSNTRGGNVGMRSNGLQKWTWQNAASQLGFFCLGANMRSSQFPKNSVSLVAVEGQPVAYKGEAFGFNFMLQNDGSNAINNITVEYGITGEEPITQTVNVTSDWGFNQSVIMGVPDFVAANPTKGSDITVKVTKINGEDNTSDSPSGSYSVTIVPDDVVLPRNVVIEEFTSTSCVYCPVGYTSMETIHEQYTDGTIIPVCVHVNSPGKDSMTAASYNNVWLRFNGDGVPTSTVNRYMTVYPGYYEDLIETAEMIRSLPGVAYVGANATIDKTTRTITVNTTTSFAFDYTDGDANFILSYGVTENEVGPHTQQNGYSGASQAVFGGWELQPSEVQLVYNDVARQLDTYAGISGSVPAQITAGQKYEFSHDIKLISAVSDLDKVNVVVYLINRKTKQIENACMLRAGGDWSGIDEVAIDNSDAPAEYFNLQGVRIANPSNGLYIRRQGDKVSKIIVK